jgi:hypothetical protein
VDNKALRVKCINLIVDDWINAGDLVSSLRVLLIVGQPSLDTLPIEELKQHVWDRYEHSFDPDEIDELSENDEAFVEWIMKKSVENHHRFV